MSHVMKRLVVLLSVSGLNKMATGMISLALNNVINKNSFIFPPPNLFILGKKYM